MEADRKEGDGKEGDGKDGDGKEQQTEGKGRVPNEKGVGKKRDVKDWRTSLRKRVATAPVAKLVERYVTGKPIKGEKKPPGSNPLKRR